MGTRWQVTIDGPLQDPARLQAECQATVDLVDLQMSTWNRDSDLMRLNAAPVGEWVALPPELLFVLQTGLQVSHLTDGAFEMNLGDAVRAWGFLDTAPSLAAIRAASTAPRIPATQALELGEGRARARAPLALDLSGIAKGYAVDRLADLLAAWHLPHALVEIDGELRATGPRRDGSPWSVAVQDPNTDAAHSVFALTDGAIATSGDYRHFVTLRSTRLSHTMDPKRGAPLVDAPASVSVLAPTCIMADAMATALMVMGPQAATFATTHGIQALVLKRAAQPQTRTI
ncbi:MAG: thiamine biosynthesis protein ApbE [Rhodobacteraceae bacterium PARR1]|nr:MAG: thiamine biosynthesis protein ApbE [Rhodobacteraceae bacterium PARR1]